MTSDELEDLGLVEYCKRCHSLFIGTSEELAWFGGDGSYCRKCGSTDIGTCTEEEWEIEERRIEDIRRNIEWRK